jgi:hypothetical protein
VSLTMIWTSVGPIDGLDLDAPACRRELDGVRQQVPQDLAQPRGVARDVRTVSAIETWTVIVFASAAGRRVSTAPPIRSRRSTGVTLRRRLPAGHRRQLEQLLDDLHLRSGVALDRSRMRLVARAATVPRRSIRVHPSTRLSGVRSSWRASRGIRLHAIRLLEVANQLRAFLGESALVIFELPRSVTSITAPVAKRGTPSSSRMIRPRSCSQRISPPARTMRYSRPYSRRSGTASLICGHARARGRRDGSWRSPDVVERALGLDGVEAEDPIQDFVVNGEVGAQVHVPRAHARGAERVPETLPGEEDVLRGRHGLPRQMHTRCLSGTTAGPACRSAMR